MQEWKAGRGQMSFLSPKFQPDPDLSDQLVPRPPSLKLRRMTGNGHLEIPRDVRDKWLAGPVRRNLPSMIFNVVLKLFCNVNCLFLPAFNDIQSCFQFTFTRYYGGMLLFVLRMFGWLILCYLRS